MKRLCGAACFLLLLLFRSKTAFAGYTWLGDTSPYVDYNSGMDYARPYIEAMRRAKAVSGWLSSGSYYFRPTQLSPGDDAGSGPRATRAWYGMALTERLTALDQTGVLVPGTDWYWDGRRWFVPYADQMLNSGLISAGAFSDGTMARQEAFSWVIKMCGLEPVAQAMSESDVSAELATMTDGSQVSPEYRHDVALAIKLVICYGDEGHKINPLAELWREHGAIIVYRVVAVNVWPDPGVVAPKEGQTTAIHAENVGLGTVNSWTLSVQDGSMATVRQWSSASLPDVLATWDGKDGGGKIVPPGLYYLRLSMDYTPADATTPITLEIPARMVRVDGRELTASVSTIAAASGSAPFVEARTVGAPTMLRADASWGSSTPLVYDPARGTYTGAIAVSSSLARGVYQITVLAVLTDDGLSPKTFTCKADIVAGGALPIEDPASPSTPYRRPDLPLEIRLKRLER